MLQKLKGKLIAALGEEEAGKAIAEIEADEAAKAAPAPAPAPAPGADVLAGLVEGEGDYHPPAAKYVSLRAEYDRNYLCKKGLF